MKKAIMAAWELFWKPVIYNENGLLITSILWEARSGKEFISLYMLFVKYTVVLY